MSHHQCNDQRIICLHPTTRNIGVSTQLAYALPPEESYHTSKYQWKLSISSTTHPAFVGMLTNDPPPEKCKLMYHHHRIISTRHTTKKSWLHDMLIIHQKTFMACPTIRGKTTNRGESALTPTIRGKFSHVRTEMTVITVKECDACEDSNESDHSNGR